MKEFYQLSKDEVLEKTDAGPQGLTARQAADRLQTTGPNALAEAKKATPLQIFLSQFKDLMVIILIVAALISAFTGDAESTIVIIAVLILNAVLGTVQHVKAEKSLESLKSLSSPHAKVLRDGTKIEINSADVVPGDILLLEAGDMVTADGRILDNYSLQVNESSLTGESANVNKEDREFSETVPLGDRVNMVYSGSLVTYGRANVMVTATGMQTEIGKIASMMNATKEKRTPLQISLDKFSGKLAIAIMIICGLVFALQIWRGQPLMTSLLFAVALAVAAIPEALSSIVTIVQAMGTQKMAKEHAIIKNLSAVEALGCVSVICSDKTGTLTQNKMTVQDIYIGGKVLKPKQLDLKNQLHRYLLYDAVLDNDSDIVDGEGIGDPTEYALLEMYRNVPGIRVPISADLHESTVDKDDHNQQNAISQDAQNQETNHADNPNQSIAVKRDRHKCEKNNNPESQKQEMNSNKDSRNRTLILSDTDLRQALPRMQEVAFDSDRKLMSTKHRIHGISTIFTKGAVDVLLDRCTNIRVDSDDQLTTEWNDSKISNCSSVTEANKSNTSCIRPITDADKKEILAQNLRFSENGLRVLAFAYKESEEDLTRESEFGFTFLGLISEMDPPRQESAEAVARAEGAGIRTVMITGDHKVTATAIAKQIGIFHDGDLAVTGLELDAMPDEELDQKIEKISVYARVSPENKIRIVDAWQRKGRIVSMTGDGVNDAPALKKADIGVAMGITGTEVSKDAASMILTDDNFATIIKAVANGRTIYENIRNAIMYLLSGNLSAIITVLFASLAVLPVPFKAVQLLFINLVTDSLPALAIGMEPGEDDILNRKPRDPKSSILDRTFTSRVVLQGALLSVSVIAAYLIGLQSSADIACTMAFSTLTFARLFHGFNCRNEHSLFWLGFKRNPYSLGAFFLGLVLLSLILFVPGLHSLFAVMPLTGIQYLMIAILAFLPTCVIQIVKVVREKKKAR